MIVVLNKSDKANTEKLVKWMKDYEEFLVNILNINKKIYL